MSTPMKFETASVYQLALRTLTPEGTLKAAEKLLPFLSELGPKYIQLVALAKADEGEDRNFWSKRQIASGTENPKNSYRIADYFTVDEEYGTDEDLLDFVAEAHRVGLRVILDLVYLHCGPNAVFLPEHPEYIVRDENGEPWTGESWPFRLINFKDQGLREYLWSNMTYLVEKYDIDGYRCDVGDQIPLDFWAEGIRRVRKIKEDFLMIDEGSNPEYLTEFDANYFYDGCFDAVPVAQGKMTAEEFQKKWDACRKSLPKGGRMLHFIDNHDVASDCFEDRHEKTIGTAGVDALLALDFLLDGIPFVFNGYEVADDLKHNMFSNRFHGRDACINWANILCEKGRKRFDLLKKLFSLRSSEKALFSTELIWAEHTAPESVIAFIRPDDKAPIFAAVNMTGRPVSLQVEDSSGELAELEPILSENVEWDFKDGKRNLTFSGYGYLAAHFPGKV